jgi:hypothetical protein
MVAVFRIARKKYLGYLVMVIGLIAGVMIPSHMARAQSGFITASGTSLMLNGQPFKYIGFDTGMEGVCWDGNNWTTAEMDTYFSHLPPDGMTRIFTVQNAGTSIVSQIVTEAAKYNQHLIFVLGDDNSYCSDTSGSPSGAGSGKTLAFYQSGWRGNYLSWVNTIVPMFADNPTIAMWEVANEPFHTGATNVPLATMESYVSGTAAAVRADDPNHLISVAPADTGDLGGSSNYTAVMNDPNINVLDFHDYAWDYENGAEISSNFAQVQSAAQQLNKPFMVDEAGVEAGTGCTPTPGASNAGLTFQGRVTYLITKANDYLSSGASGIAFWDYEQDGSNCTYEVIPPSDPMIAAVQNYGGANYITHSNTSGGNTGYCIDDPHNTTTNGTQLQVWQCHNVAQEKWTAKPSSYGSGYYELQTTNGRCLDNHQSVAKNGNIVDIYTCNNTDAQAWAPKEKSGYQTWVNSNGYCLDLIGNNNANGALLQIWQCLGNSNQAWIGP